jgi:hypothetical protein
MHFGVWWLLTMLHKWGFPPTTGVLLSLKFSDGKSQVVLQVIQP